MSARAGRPLYQCSKDFGLGKNADKLLKATRRYVAEKLGSDQDFALISQSQVLDELAADFIQEHSIDLYRYMESPQCPKDEELMIKCVREIIVRQRDYRRESLGLPRLIEDETETMSTRSNTIDGDATSEGTPLSVIVVNTQQESNSDGHRATRSHLSKAIGPEYAPDAPELPPKRLRRDGNFGNNARVDRDTETLETDDYSPGPSISSSDESVVHLSTRSCMSKAFAKTQSRSLLSGKRKRYTQHKRINTQNLESFSDITSEQSTVDSSYKDSTQTPSVRRESISTATDDQVIEFRLATQRFTLTPVQCQHVLESVMRYCDSEMEKEKRHLDIAKTEDEKIWTQACLYKVRAIQNFVDSEIRKLGGGMQAKQ